MSHQEFRPTPHLCLLMTKKNPQPAHHQPHRTLLLLHGSRQTGQLLLGRMDKLRKKLRDQQNISVKAIDAPFAHPDDADMRQWWKLEKEENVYIGLNETLELVQREWNSCQNTCIGLMGFSQGARLVHLLLLLHTQDPEKYVPGIQFGILVSGYEAPVPGNMPISTSFETKIQIPSLHVYGASDQLIVPESSRAVAEEFNHALLHEHEGGHHVPMRAASIKCYLEFVEQQQQSHINNETVVRPEKEISPDTLEIQRDEVEALQAIYPDEFTLLSETKDGTTEQPLPTPPISFSIALEDECEGVTLQFRLPSTYPETSIPDMELQCSTSIEQELQQLLISGCVKSMQSVCHDEMGNPTVLSAVTAARDFWGKGGKAAELREQYRTNEQEKAVLDTEAIAEVVPEPAETDSDMPMDCSEERIQTCIQEGLEIAERLRRPTTTTTSSTTTADTATTITRSGGSYKLTLGLVGKPSAGKSTFFNAATAFARQRGDDTNALGGATMAPHPFTTIDPNVGYCLVPAPVGSCPEESDDDRTKWGCTHGRDADGQRLIPVLIKDVAGLVPGAYQGRGRGNQFLNDLTDAVVLIHILDSSGLADEGGNAVGIEADGITPAQGGSHPLNDLAWIRKELLEWIYSNLMHKWSAIRKRGRSKLEGMFSGYGQTEAVTQQVLHETEMFAAEKLGRDRIVDSLDGWDKGDVIRLVSAFLGVRFPVVLALNKKDLPQSATYIDDIQEALPIHGAHVGIPLSAHSEMSFVRKFVAEALGQRDEVRNHTGAMKAIPPLGVWKCLQESVSLAKPIIMFPVSDFSTFAPMPGLSKHASEDASLPSLGMIRCVEAAGGKTPSLWDPKQRIYTPITNNNKIRPHHTLASAPLRDAIVMKAGSTVEDLFLTLKRLGAFGGEFIRAEAMCNLTDTPKPITKHYALSQSVRIIRIMTSKRTAWQK